MKFADAAVRCRCGKREKAGLSAWEGPRLHAATLPKMSTRSSLLHARTILLRKAADATA